MNEAWASEVERRLRTISDRIVSLNQNALRLEGQANLGLPTTVPPEGTEADEVQWIRLTDKAVIGGVNTYAWRRQIYVMTGGGMAWVDSGEFGTIFENPAIGLNNENVLTTDGKRYPAKFNPDTGQWIFFLRLKESSTSVFVDRLRVRQTAGQHYPSGSPGTYELYTSPNSPGRLRFWSFASSTALQIDNFDVSDYTFAWTELEKISEVDIGGLIQATYRLNDENGYEIGFVSITEAQAGEGWVLTIRKTVRQIENGTINYTFISRLSGASAIGDDIILLSGTSGFYDTGLGGGGGNQITLTDSVAVYRGGNSRFEICWGSGCNAAESFDSVPEASYAYSAGAATSVRLARSVLSNSINPSRMTTTATVQYGQTDPNPLALLIQVDSSLSATSLALVFAQTQSVAAQTTATAYAYGETGDMLSIASASTLAQAMTVPRANPASSATTIFANLDAVALATPTPNATPISIAPLCAITEVATPQPVSNPAGISTSLGSVFPIPPIAAISQTETATASGAYSINPTNPDDTMFSAETTLTITTVRTPSAPVTEANPRITVTTTCTATAEETGITPKP
jgi:hypothetical protein